MNFNFFERSGHIHIRLNQGTKMTRFSSGIELHGIWDKDRQRAKGTSQKVFDTNKKLAEYETLISSLIAEGLNMDQVKDQFLRKSNLITEDNTLYLLKEYHDYIQNIQSGNIRKKNNSPLAHNTIKSLKIAYDAYEDFVKDSRQQINLAEMDLSSVPDFKVRAKKKAELNSHITDFRNWMAEEDYSVSTQLVYITKLISFIKFIADQYCLTLQVSFNSMEAKFDRVFIDPELVIKTLGDTSIRETLPDNEKYFYDLAVTMLFSTLRFSDALVVKPEMIVKTDTGHALKTINRKTGKETSAPIPQSILQIYQDNIQKYGQMLFPTKASEWILSGKPQYYFAKVFSKIQGYDTIISKKQFDANGKFISAINKPLCEWLTPHVFRRSAITTMIYQGVSREAIKNLSGHSDVSTSFSVYVGYVEKFQHKEMDKFITAIDNYGA